MRLETSAPSPDSLRKLDLSLMRWVFALLVLFVVALAADRPPPDPDYYVYLLQAKDMASLGSTAQKFAPGYPALIAPFIRAAPVVIENWARVLDIISFAALGVALFRIRRRLNLVGGILMLAGVLGNRYTLITALNCTSHLPFVALSAWCLVCALEARWMWAYALAVLALAMRYEGFALPFFVAFAQIVSMRKNSEPMRFGKVVAPLILAAICLIPTALWMRFGTEKGPGDYVKETQLRGTAGPRVAQYIAAGAMVSFTDEKASDAIVAGAKPPKALFGIATIVLFGCAAVGVWGLFRSDLVAALWMAGSILWWLAVHMRFADVGGEYFYSVQTTWLVWIAVVAAASKWLLDSHQKLFVIVVPMALAAVGGVFSAAALIVATAAVTIAFVSRQKHAAPVAATSFALVIFAFAAGYEKIYQTNFRPACRQFLAWAESHANVLVSPYMLDQWQADGSAIPQLVSEELIDGTDLAASLQKRNIRYAAVTSREMDYRSEEEFLEGHEFFLGSRYKTSLRPYGLLFPIFKRETWKKIDEFRVRDSWVRIYSCPDPANATNRRIAN